MQSELCRDILIPSFVQSRTVQVAVATSAFCNANCEFCIWPYMESDSSVMSIDCFRRVLDRFEGFRFSEFALSVINEPFIDRTICRKLLEIAERHLQITSVFFSSNWLLPTQDRIREFVDALENCYVCPTIQNVSLNATVSGIDEETYDRGQAGATLTGTVTRYRRLNFEKAVNNVCLLSRRLATLRFEKPLVLFIKAYSDEFTLEEMEAFWRRTLRNAGVPVDFVRDHVRVKLNHDRITFARFSQSSQAFERWNLPRACAGQFLTDKLVIGTRGQMGLCCQDGIRTVVLGNIIEEPLMQIVSSTVYQDYLRIVTGLEAPGPGHPCQHCEFYTVSPHDVSGLVT